MGGDRWAELLQFWVYSGVVEVGSPLGGQILWSPENSLFESVELRACCTRVVYVD